MGISQLGGTSTRLVTKANAGGVTYVNVSLFVGSGATSAWGQIFASSPDILIVGVGMYSTTSWGGIALASVVDVAIGGAGSESVQGSFPLMSAGNTNANSYQAGWMNLSVPLRIGTGQRVTLRVAQATTWGTGATCIVHAAYVPYANVEGN